MSEMQRNIAVEVEREACLDRLIKQAGGQQVDAIDDRYLIEQLNAAHIGDAYEGAVTECQVVGCALRCLTQNEHGVLKLVATRGQKACS